MPQRKAASVFPDPVGDKISVFSPDAILGHPNRCGGVASAKEVSNQARTGAEKGFSGSAGTSITVLATGNDIPGRPKLHPYQGFTASVRTTYTDLYHFCR